MLIKKYWENVSRLHFEPANLGMHVKLAVVTLV